MQAEARNKAAAVVHELALLQRLGGIRAESPLLPGSLLSQQEDPCRVYGGDQLQALVLF